MRRRPQIFRRRLLYAFERDLVGIRPSAIHLALRQPVRFSAEPTNPLDSADKVRLVLSLDALHLLWRRSIFQKSRQFFIQFLFHLRNTLSRPRRRPDVELTANFF